MSSYEEPHVNCAYRNRHTHNCADDRPDYDNYAFHSVIAWLTKPSRSPYQDATIYSAVVYMPVPGALRLFASIDKQYGETNDNTDNKAAY